MEKRIIKMVMDFVSLEDGINYMNLSSNKCAFHVNGEYYYFNGSLFNDGYLQNLLEDIELKYISPENLILSVNPKEGEMYIEGGFLQYFIFV
jgi:hypothetical protein